jgi:hypothetical protein
MLFCFLRISSNTMRLTLWLTRKVNQEVNQDFMKASVSVICYKHKVLANGESPLMLRIAKDGKRTMKSLGILLILPIGTLVEISLRTIVRTGILSSNLL